MFVLPPAVEKRLRFPPRKLGSEGAVRSGDCDTARGRAACLASRGRRAVDIGAELRRSESAPVCKLGGQPYSSWRIAPASNAASLLSSRSTSPAPFDSPVAIRAGENVRPGAPGKYLTTRRFSSICIGRRGSRQLRLQSSFIRGRRRLAGGWRNSAFHGMQSGTVVHCGQCAW